MVKFVSKRVSFLLGVSLIFLFCVTTLFPIKAKASDVIDFVTEDVQDIYSQNLHLFQLNTEYESAIGSDTQVVYHWRNLSRINKHYNITIQTDKKKIDNIALFCYNPLPDTSTSHYYMENFKSSYDKDNRIYTYSLSLMSDKEKYALAFDNTSLNSIQYTIKITEEPEIVLAQTAISEITNTKQRTMTVKYAPVKKRLGYQIEYATDNKFKDKARVNTGAATKDIGKLTKGKTYYVRVRTYARYSDGTLVYSKWSGTRKIKIIK